MEKNKIAKIISTISNPPIICIPLFLIICLILSYENGILNLNKFLSLELISIIFSSILPMAIIIVWAKKIGTDKDISKRTDRFIPLIIGMFSYFIGFLTCYIFNIDHFLTILLLCYSINTGVVLVITTKWKISVHTTGLSGPVAALIMLTGPFGAIFGILYPILIWSRVILNKHTLAQAITGAVQGFFLAILEMYIFTNLFNLNIHIISLTDSLFFIIAIITTPIILGVLSYNKPSRNLFIFFELICLILFIFIMPLNAVLIFILVSLISIFISYFAGSDFVWFKVLNSS